MNSIPTGPAIPTKNPSKRVKASGRSVMATEAVPEVTVATRLIENCGWPTDAEPRVAKRPKRN